MHDCPDCGRACDCDGEDLWYDSYANCECDCDDDLDDDDYDGEYDDE